MRLVLLALFVVAACGHNAPAPQSVVGWWEILPPTGARGPQFTMHLDSIVERDVYATLKRALSGDVELERERFAPIRGALADDGTLVLPIITRTGDQMVGEIRLDTIPEGGLRLQRLTWGGTEVPNPTAWTVRRPT